MDVARCSSHLLAGACRGTFAVVWFAALFRPEVEHVGRQSRARCQRRFLQDGERKQKPPPKESAEELAECEVSVRAFQHKGFEHTEVEPNI